MANVITLGEAEIAEHAAALVAGALLRAIEATGHARLAISGGSATSPIPEIRRTLSDDWDLVWLTWVDERCVDKADDDSNRGALYRSHVLSDLCPPGLELPLWLDGESPTAAAERVSKSIADDFGGGLDACLLGMGPDGHIASLFPGREAMQVRDAAVAHVPDSPKPPSARMTLTLPILTTSSHNVLIAMGEAKREALSRLAAGDPKLPATHLANLTVLTDIQL